MVRVCPSLAMDPRRRRGTRDPQIDLAHPIYQQARDGKWRTWPPSVVDADWFRPALVAQAIHGMVTRKRYMRLTTIAAGVPTQEIVEALARAPQPYLLDEIPWPHLFWGTRVPVCRPNDGVTFTVYARGSDGQVHVVTVRSMQMPSGVAVPRDYHEEVDVVRGMFSHCSCAYHVESGLICKHGGAALAQMAIMTERKRLGMELFDQCSRRVEDVLWRSVPGHQLPDISAVITMARDEENMRLAQTLSARYGISVPPYPAAPQALPSAGSCNSGAAGQVSREEAPPG